MHFIREDPKRVVNYTSCHFPCLLINVKRTKSGLLLKDLCAAATVWNLRVHFVLDPLQFQTHHLLLWDKPDSLVARLAMNC
jgi:hypothetical protein